MARYKIDKVIPDLHRSDVTARKQINIKEDELKKIETEIENQIESEILKESLEKENLTQKKDNVEKNKEEYEKSLDKVTEEEVLEKSELAKNKFVEGYTLDIDKYQDEAVFRTEKAMDMLNFKSITNAIIKQKWEARKLENMGDKNKETVALPNDSYDDNIQTSLRLNPDYYSTPRNVFMTMRSSIQTPLLICKLEALDVEYRNQDYLNSDLGAFQLKLQIRGNNTAIDVELFSTLISVGKYGCAIFSEGSRHDDDTLGLLVYKKHGTNDIYIALQNKENENNKDTITFDINVSVLLGDGLELPSDNSTIFNPNIEGYVLIGEAEFKTNNSFEYGPKNLELTDRNYSDRVMNDRVYSSDDIFGNTQMVRISSIESDAADANVEFLPITEREQLNNALLENQVMLGSKKKIAYMDNYRENLPYLDYFDKEASLLYLGTNDGLVLYKDSGSFMEYHPEFSDVKIIKVLYHSFSKKLYVLTNEGLYYSDEKNGENIFSNFTQYNLPSIDYEYREDLIAEDSDTTLEQTKQRNNTQTQTYHYDAEDMEIMDFIVSSTDYNENTPRDSKTADFMQPIVKLETNSENYGVSDYLETRINDNIIRILIIDSKVYKYKNFNEKEEVTFDSRNVQTLNAQCLFKGIDKEDGSDYFGIIFDKSIFMSKDLETWVEMNFPTAARNKNWVQCQYIDFGGTEGGKFIAITDSENDTHRILMSRNGKEWFTKELPNVTGKWRYMAAGYIGGEYNRIVLVLVAYEGINDRIAVSVNGEDYIIKDLKFGGKLKGIQYIDIDSTANDYEEKEQSGNIYGFMKRGFLVYGETYSGKIGLFYSWNANDWLNCEPLDTELNKSNIMFDIHLTKDLIESYGEIYNKTASDIATALQMGYELHGKSFLTHKIVTNNEGNTVCEIKAKAIGSDLNDNRLCVKGFKLNDFDTIQNSVDKTEDLLNTTLNSSNVYEIDLLSVNEYRGENRILFFVKDNNLNVTKYSSQYVSAIVDEYSVPYHQEVLLLKLWLRGFVHDIPRNSVVWKTFSSYFDDYYNTDDAKTKKEGYWSKFHIGGIPKASQQKLMNDEDGFINQLSIKKDQIGIENFVRNQSNKIANTYLFPGGMIVLGERIAYEKTSPDKKLSERFLIMSNEYNDDREFNLGSENSDMILTGAMEGHELFFKNSEDFHPFQQSLSMIYGNKEMTKILLVARGNQKVGLISADKGNSYEWSADELIENNSTYPFEKNSSEYLKNTTIDAEITNISIDEDEKTGELYILEKAVEKPTYSTPPQREGSLKYILKVELIDWVRKSYDLSQDYLDDSKYTVWQTYGSGESGFNNGRWIDTQQFKNFYENYNDSQQMNFYLYDLTKLSTNLNDAEVLKNLTKFYLNIVKIDENKETISSINRIKLEDYMSLADAKLHFWHVIKSPIEDKVLLMTADETSNDASNAYMKEVKGYRLFSLSLDKSYNPVNRIKEIVLKDTDWSFVQSMVSYGVPNSGNPWVQYHTNGEITALLSHDVREILTSAVLTVLDNTKITFKDDMTNDEDTTNVNITPLKRLDGLFFDNNKFYMSSNYRISTDDVKSDYWSLKAIDVETGVTEFLNAKEFFNLPEADNDIFSIVRKLTIVPTGLKHAYLLFKNTSANVEDKPKGVNYFYIVTETAEGTKSCYRINLTSVWNNYTISNIANNGEFAVIIEENTTVTRCSIEWTGTTPSLNFNIGSYSLPTVGLKTFIDSKTTLDAYKKFSSWEILVNETQTILRYKYGYKQSDFDAISKVETENMLLAFSKVYQLIQNTQNNLKSFVEIQSDAIWSNSTTGNTVYYYVNDIGNEKANLSDDKVSYAKNIFNVTDEADYTSNLAENDIMLLAVDGIDSRDLINSQNPGDSLQLSENSLLIQSVFKKKESDGTNPTIFSKFSIYHISDIEDASIKLILDSKYPTYDYSVKDETVADDKKKWYVPYVEIKLLKDNSVMVFTPQCITDDKKLKWNKLNVQYCIYHEDNVRWRTIKSDNQEALNVENLDKYFEVNREALYDYSSDNMYFFNGNILTKIPYSNQPTHDDSIYNIKKYHFAKIDEEGNILSSIKFDRKTLPWASEFPNGFGIDFIADFSINKVTDTLIFSTAIRFGMIYKDANEIAYTVYPQKALDCFTHTHTGTGQAVTLKVVSNDNNSTIALFVPRTVANSMIINYKKKANISTNTENEKNFIDAKTNYLLVHSDGNWKEFDLNSISYVYSDEVISDIANGLELEEDIKNNLKKVELINLIKDLFITESGRIVFFLNREFFINNTQTYWLGDKNFSAVHYLEYGADGNWTYNSPTYTAYSDVSILKYSSKYLYNRSNRRLIGIADSTQGMKLDINSYRSNVTSYLLFGYIDKLVNDGSYTYKNDTSEFFQTKLKGLTSFRPFVEGFSTITKDGELILIDPIAHRVFDISKVDFDDLWNDRVQSYPDMIYSQRDYNITNAEVLKSIKGVLVGNFFYSGVYEDFNQYDWDYKQELMNQKDYYIKEIYYGENDSRNHFLFIHKKYNFAYKVTRYIERNISEGKSNDDNWNVRKQFGKTFKHTNDADLNIWNRKGEMDKNNALLYKTLEETGMPYDVPCKAKGYLIFEGQCKPISAIKITQPFYDTGDDRVGMIGGIEFVLDQDVTRSIQDVTYRFSHMNLDYLGVTSTKKTKEQFVGNNPLISMGPIELLETMDDSENYDMKQVSNAFSTEQIVTMKINRKNLGSIHAEVPNLYRERLKGYHSIRSAFGITSEVIDGKLIGYRSNGKPFVIDLENNLVTAENYPEIAISREHAAINWKEMQVLPNSKIKVISAGCNTLYFQNPETDSIYDWHKANVIMKTDYSNIKDIIDSDVPYNTPMQLLYAFKDYVVAVMRKDRKLYFLRYEYIKKDAVEDKFISTNSISGKLWWNFDGALTDNDYWLTPSYLKMTQNSDLLLINKSNNIQKYDSSNSSSSSYRWVDNRLIHYKYLDESVYGFYLNGKNIISAEDDDQWESFDVYESKNSYGIFSAITKIPTNEADALDYIWIVSAQNTESPKIQKITLGEKFKLANIVYASDETTNVIILVNSDFTKSHFISLNNGETFEKLDAGFIFKISLLINEVYLFVNTKIAKNGKYLYVLDDKCYWLDNPNYDTIVYNEKASIICLYNKTYHKLIHIIDNNVTEIEFYPDLEFEEVLTVGDEHLYWISKADADDDNNVTVVGCLNRFKDIISFKTKFELTDTISEDKKIKITNDDAENAIYHQLKNSNHYEYYKKVNNLASQTVYNTSIEETNETNENIFSCELITYDHTIPNNDYDTLVPIMLTKNNEDRREILLLRKVLSDSSQVLDMYKLIFSNESRSASLEYLNRNIDLNMGLNTDHYEKHHLEINAPYYYDENEDCYLFTLRNSPTVNNNDTKACVAVVYPSDMQKSHLKLIDHSTIVNDINSYLDQKTNLTDLDFSFIYNGYIMELPQFPNKLCLFIQNVNDDSVYSKLVTTKARTDNQWITDKTYDMNVYKYVKRLLLSMPFVLIDKKDIFSSNTTLTLKPRLPLLSNYFIDNKMDFLANSPFINDNAMPSWANLNPNQFEFKDVWFYKNKIYISALIYNNALRFQTRDNDVTADEERNNLPNERVEYSLNDLNQNTVQYNLLELSFETNEIPITRTYEQESLMSLIKESKGRRWVPKFLQGFDLTLMFAKSLKTKDPTTINL